MGIIQRPEDARTAEEAEEQNDKEAPVGADPAGGAEDDQAASVLQQKGPARAGNVPRPPSIGRVEIEVEIEAEIEVDGPPPLLLLSAAPKRSPRSAAVRSRF